MWSSWGAGNRTVDLETESMWLTAIWSRLHLKNGTESLDLERQAVEGRCWASLDFDLGSATRKLGLPGKMTSSLRFADCFFINKGVMMVPRPPRVIVQIKTK